MSEKKILQTGIDISKWQKDFDMAKALEEGFTFAIIKGGGADVGFYVDKKFEQNYQNAKNLKMSVGSYWFSKALTIEDANKEADWYYENCLKGKQFELPVYMDVEHKEMLALGKRKLTDVIHAFCQNLEKKGYMAGVYSSTGAYLTYILDEELTRYPIWVAQYNNVCTYKGEYGMWQYGGEVNFIRSPKVAGATCDQDYLYVDYETIIKEKGLNGFSIEEESKQENSPTEENIYATGDSVLIFELEKDAARNVSANFKVSEFACKESKAVIIHPLLIDWCQSARNYFKTPLSIKRGYDIIDENSAHYYGKAVDILANDKVSRDEMYHYFSDLLGNKYEVCLCDWGIHLAITDNKNRYIKI